jgi:hypothetical protein
MRANKVMPLLCESSQCGSESFLGRTQFIEIMELLHVKEAKINIQAVVD